MSDRLSQLRNLLDKDHMMRSVCTESRWNTPNQEITKKRLRGLTEQWKLTQPIVMRGITKHACKNKVGTQWVQKKTLEEGLVQADEAGDLHAQEEMKAVLQSL